MRSIRTWLAGVLLLLASLVPGAAGASMLGAVFGAGAPWPLALMGLALVVLFAYFLMLAWGAFTGGNGSGRLAGDLILTPTRMLTPNYVFDWEAVDRVEVDKGRGVPVVRVYVRERSSEGVRQRKGGEKAALPLRYAKLGLMTSWVVPGEQVVHVTNLWVTRPDVRASMGSPESLHLLDDPGLR